jgi:predicted amidohydrolase
MILLCLGLFYGCNDSPSDPGLPPHDPPPGGPVMRVALVRLAIGPDLTSQISELTGKIQTVASDVGNVVDVVVTPEYSLTSSLSTEYHQYAIDFACDGNFDNCTIASAGGARSDDVLAAVQALRSLAMAHGFYLFLGTVIERFDASAIPEIPDAYVYFNDLVIIDPQGTISIKRKTSDDWQSSCIGGSPCSAAIEAEALETVRSYAVVTRQSDTLDVFPMICGERYYPPMLNHALNQGLAGLDALIGPEREGDTPYESITEAIQTGAWTENTMGWTGSIEAGFIDNYVNTGLLKSDAYLAASDGESGTAGLINLAKPPAPVPEYIRKNEYMFGAVHQ